LISDPLDNGANNLLNDVFYNSVGVPDGATFTKWDPVNNTFLPLSVYNASTQLWSINYSLAPAQGGLLHSPSTSTANVTEVGTVLQFPNIFVVEQAGDWAPNYPNGLYLMSAPVPLSDAVSTMFFKTTARDPVDGEWVNILDPVTQTY